MAYWIYWVVECQVISLQTKVASDELQPSKCGDTSLTTILTNQPLSVPLPTRLVSQGIFKVFWNVLGPKSDWYPLHPTTNLNLLDNILKYTKVPGKSSYLREVVCFGDSGNRLKHKLRDVESELHVASEASHNLEMVKWLVIQTVGYLPPEMIHNFDIFRQISTILHGVHFVWFQSGW